MFGVLRFAVLSMLLRGQAGRVVTAPLGRHGTSAMKTLYLIGTRAATKRCDRGDQSADADDYQQEDDHHGSLLCTPRTCMSHG